MTKPARKLATYHWVALGLSIAASLASFVFAVYLLQHPSSGYGMLGEAFILALMLVVTAILLLHSFIVSIIYCVKNPPKSYWGILVNMGLIVLLLSPLIFQGVKALVSEHQYKTSFEYRFYNACAEKSPKTVLKMINQMPADIKSNGYDDQIYSCIEVAIQNKRIELLNALEANQITVVTKDAENTWRKLIDIAANDQDIDQQNLALLEWLAKRGEQFNYKLEPAISFFSHYNICYTNLQSADAQQFAERLISLGADINAGEDVYTAWYCSRFDRIDALQFLSKHNLAIKNNPDYNSALGEAIANRNSQMIELLIKIGAKPLYIDQQNARRECLEYSSDEIAQDSCAQIRDYDDLITACTYAKQDGWTEDNNKIISLLQQAGFRFEKNPDYQALEINDAETLKCLKGFEGH
jgi:hypothetical protein